MVQIAEKQTKKISVVKLFTRNIEEDSTKDQELIDPLQVKINHLLETKQKLEVQEVEIIKIKTSQSVKIELENSKLKKRLEKLKCEMVEGNLIMHGLREDVWELDDNHKERICHAIAPTMDADNRRERLNIARSISIKSTTRLGKYKDGKNHQVSIVFEKKIHTDILFESKSWLPQGIYNILHIKSGKSM